MTQKQKRVVAKFVAQPGQAEALRAAIQRCVAPSRAEEGNVHYDLYQSVEEAGVFLIHETWHSDAAILFHFEQPHFQQLLADTQPLLVGEPDIHCVDL